MTPIDEDRKHTLAQSAGDRFHETAAYSPAPAKTAVAVMIYPTPDHAFLALPAQQIFIREDGLRKNHEWQISPFGNFRKR